MSRYQDFLKIAVVAAGVMAIGFASCTKQTIQIKDTEPATGPSFDPLTTGGAECTSIVRDFELEILKPVLVPHCADCHNSGDKPFVLKSGESPRFVDLLEDFNLVAKYSQKDSESAGDSLLVAKATGRVPHEGGKVLSKTSFKLLALQKFEKRMSGQSDCAEKIEPAEKKVLKCITDDLKPVFAAASQAAFENCVRCHGTGRGRLKFDAEVSQYNENQMISGFGRFFALDPEGTSALLMQKPLGESGHGGGPILLESSEDYAKIKGLGVAVQSSSDLSKCLKAAFP